MCACVSIVSSILNSSESIGEKKWAMITVWSNFFEGIEWFLYGHRMNIKCFVSRSFSNQFHRKKQFSATLRRQHLDAVRHTDVRGPSVYQTILFMRSIIITIFCTYILQPPNQTWRPQPKLCVQEKKVLLVRYVKFKTRHRKKIWMTSEVRKCPKSLFCCF